ncbi:FliH/SctL family protein [Comamonas terrigena]|uniref:FliH/SctL family protein n=1 Tax=Comamonas terrigena TaxID=32013 RepID=UPI002356C7F1|nr:FliH/SctL family protein [Comamonas terrigena]
MTSSTHHYARFIPSEEIDAQSVRHWQFGDVQKSAPGAALQPLHELATLTDLLPPPAPQGIAAQALAEDAVVAEEENAVQLREEEVHAQLEQARQESHDAGYEAGMQAGHGLGLEEGKQQAGAEWQHRFDDYMAQQGRQAAEQLQAVLQAAQRDVQGMQQHMAPDVLQLACDIARQVVRQELRSNPQALLPVVREALDMMSAESKPATVRLNPQDWERLQEPLKAAHPQPKIEWLADASVKPGDCLVESAGAQVDGSLERRWQRAVAALGLVSTWYDGAPAHGQ